MNRPQTAALLALIDSLDPYVSKSMDPTTGAARLSAWNLILADVPLDFARPWTERYFLQPRDSVLQPATIRAAYFAEEARQERLAPDPIAKTADDLFQSAPDWVRPYYEACQAAAAAGEPLPDPPHKQMTTTLVRANDRDRACGVKNCMCTHVDCYAGWLTDDEDTAHRCPTCADAVNVREILAEEKGRRRR